MPTIPLNVKCTQCADGWMHVRGEYVYCDTCDPQPEPATSAPAP
ncbi:hypothetical protein [Herbiconiux solani]|nr:hypothetical protein [Herbiconiux solani]